MVDETERKRRHALLMAHYDAENSGDIDGIIETFSADAIMNYNGTPFVREAIQLSHVYIGFSQADGAFKHPRNVIDRESFTDIDLIVEGRLCGTHQGEFLGFKPTGKAVELPYVAFYTFHENGKLVSERVVMNLGPLLEGYYPAPRAG